MQSANHKFEDLASSLNGNLILPSDAAYNQARQVWNGRIDKHPAVIVRCADAQDVIYTVRWALSKGLKLSVRGGGNDFAGRSLCDDGVVVDCSQMTAVSIDPQMCTARAQGGATIAHLIDAAHKYGLVTATGVMSGVGLGGLTLGGGYGPLLGKLGLVADNLLSAQVVTASGELLTASETEHPELYWGLRGGGGNFGVVVSLEYRLYPISEVLSGSLLYTLDQAGTFLQLFSEFLKTAPDELTIPGGIIQMPDGTPMLLLAPTYCGPLDDGEKVLGSLRKLAKPQVDQIQPVAYNALIRVFDALSPTGLRRSVQTQSLDTLRIETIEILIEQARQFSSPFSALLFHNFHGAASRVPVSSTAFGLRQDHLMVEIIGTWEKQSEDEDQMHAQWVYKTSHALAPYSLPGGYVNLLDETEQARIPLAFGPNYQRLVELKRTYDADDVFNSTIGHVSPGFVNHEVESMGV